MMRKVLITGGSGLIGRRLSFLLKSRGYEVRILSRSNNPNKSYKTFLWNISEKTINDSAFEGLNHIIHLAGAGIADKRWSEKRKKEIINSRVDSTNLLYATVKRLQIPLQSFISASATGFYGSFTTQTTFKESRQFKFIKTSLDAPIDVSIYLAYRLANGDLVYSSQPFSVKIEQKE